jgi:2-deoxy-D-gluconate 3-dehydrogenase
MKAFDLSGRVAIVTGGNGGIGLGMARGLARAGAVVAVVGRNRGKNEAAVKELRGLGAQAAAFEADLRDAAECRAAVDRAAAHFGRLDILVNNAGMNIRKPPQDYALAEWDEIIKVNLTAAFVCAQAVYPHFRAVGGGKIINIGSMMSIFGAFFAVPYGASKGGIVQMTKSLACAWAKDNIQANAVLPGYINTELTQRARVDVPGLQERVEARTPAGRWGEPGDFEGIAVFLASPASDFLNGTAIPLDGGYAAAG